MRVRNARLITSLEILVESALNSEGHCDSDVSEKCADFDSASGWGLDCCFDCAVLWCDNLGLWVRVVRILCSHWPLNDIELTILGLVALPPLNQVENQSRVFEDAILVWLRIGLCTVEIGV